MFCRCLSVPLLPVLHSGQAARKPVPLPWHLFSFCLEQLNVCQKILHASLLWLCIQRSTFCFGIGRLKYSQPVHVSALPAGATELGCWDSAACWSPAALDRPSRARVNTLPGALQRGRLAKKQFRGHWVLSVMITTASSRRMLSASPPRLTDGAGSPGGHARPSRPPDGAARPHPSLPSPCMGLTGTAGQRSGTKGASIASARRAAAQPLPRLLAREQASAVQPLPSLRAGRLSLSLTNTSMK